MIDEVLQSIAAEFGEISDGMVDKLLRSEFL
jgi:hypothetical protein